MQVCTGMEMTREEIIGLTEIMMMTIRIIIKFSREGIKGTMAGTSLEVIIIMIISKEEEMKQVSINVSQKAI